MPHIGLVSDGEINFYWKSAGLAIDLSITGDGTYSFFAECEDGVSYAGEEQIGTELPSGILSKIRAVA